MTEENLRKFLYSFWNKQKKMGKEPNLDDVIYEISDLRRNTNGDFKIIDQYGMNTMVGLMF